MKLNDLQPNEGSRKSRKRVGRGISAGQGKTAGKGTKGQSSRSGEGGNLYRQVATCHFSADCRSFVVKDLLHQTELYTAK